MKIFCDSVEPSGSKGSFRIVADSLNTALSKIGSLGNKEDCDIYLLASSCDSHIRHPRAKTALFLAWEVSSAQVHVAKNLQGAIPVGISKQVADTYAAAGVKMDYIHLGVDADFWTPSNEKFSKITFVTHNTSNSRSGLESLIPAFGKAFAGNKNIRLIVKDRPGRKLQDLINRINFIFDVEIIYDTRDLSREELRELYRKSHYSIYGTNAAGFALTVPESLACGTPALVTSCPCIKEYMSEDFGLFIDHDFKPLTKKYIEKCAQFGIENSMDLQGYISEPHMWYPKYDDTVVKLKVAHEEIKSGIAAEKGAAATEWVKNNLTWMDTANKLVKLLEKTQ